MSDPNQLEMQIENDVLIIASGDAAEEGRAE